MFGIALFISFLDHLKYEKGSIIKIILYVTIIICAPIIFFDNYYNSVYIDAILGLTFGFLLLKILAQKEKYEMLEQQENRINNEHDKVFRKILSDKIEVTKFLNEQLYRRKVAKNTIIYDKSIINRKSKR